MSGIKCSSPGCTEVLWQEKQGKLQSIQSNALCMNCRQVFYCFKHFIGGWSNRPLLCPQCGQKSWQVSVKAPQLLPPHIHTAILNHGGKIRSDQAPSVQSSVQSSTQSSAQTLNKHTLNLNPSNPSNPSNLSNPSNPLNPSNPKQALQNLQQNAKNFLNQYDTYQTGMEGYHQNHHMQDSRLSVQNQMPKQWTLISASELGNDAYSIGQGLAIYRDTAEKCTLMDNERVLRTMHVEGYLLDVTQSPRKRKSIVLRQLVERGPTEMLWLNGKDVMGLISNPYDMQEQVFGATFLTDSTFAFFVVRPDQRIELREGRFNKNQIQSRLVGKSYDDVPMSGVDCEKGSMVFLIAYREEEGYLPICRRMSDGKDFVMGDYLEEAPICITASKLTTKVAWIDVNGQVYISDQNRSLRVGSSDSRLLALSDDGNALAWQNQDHLCVYDAREQRINRWPVGHLLAISWKSDF